MASKVTSREVATTNGLVSTPCNVAGNTTTDELVIGQGCGSASWCHCAGTVPRIPARTALYQQSPAPKGGNFFKVWLRLYARTPDPATHSIYGGSDYAVTADGGDYTIHVVVGVDPEDRIYPLDLWRGQASNDIWIQAFCRGDKAVRAQSIRGRMALGGLYIPAHASWYADFRAELLSFPAGKHDDHVDALGLVGQLLDRMIPGRAPKQEKPAEVPTGYKPVEDIGNVADWKTY